MAFVNAEAKIDIDFTDDDLEYCRDISGVFWYGVESVVVALKKKGIIVSINDINCDED